jgi:hypothetical protein
MAKEPKGTQATSNGSAPESGSSAGADDSSIADASRFPLSPMGNALTPEVIADTKVAFQQLAERWKASRGPATTVGMMTQHPAYKEIIRLGERAIPWLLEELNHDPDHWFAALRAITGANPVHPEDRGDLDKMAESWIEWRSSTCGSSD